LIVGLLRLVVGLLRASSSCSCTRLFFGMPPRRRAPARGVDMTVDIQVVIQLISQILQALIR
jgi:hypothetical protein